MKILNVVGARPNFMKVAPVHQAFVRAGHTAVLVHTGQHYDANMSKVFFDELGMPQPDVNLQVGSASHAVQTARVMEAFEPVLLDVRPDMVLVAGDVNSTLACALVASKLRFQVAHLEAGLRSYDRDMPEETNRVLTDHISDVLLTPSSDADANLAQEGIPKARIRLVGNAMIDTLRAHLPVAETRAAGLYRTHGVTHRDYALVTLHRPANVDDGAVLAGLVATLRQLSDELPVLFAVHPRTRARLAEEKPASRLRLIDPLGYLDFLALQAGAKMVLTDSGGIQEESTALGVACLTLRANTERPITVSEGTNTVVGTEPAAILRAAREILAHGGKSGRVPALWDGNTAARVVQVLTAR